jgi:uncharacterized protein (DUF302 family)
MAECTIQVTTRRPYEETLVAVRDHLAEAGFGVLTEIDVKATLKATLDADVALQMILGDCRPQLAHRALEVDPSIAALLPCNVVVRGTDGGSVVEAFDPEVMMSFAGDDDAGEALHAVAADARQRPTAAPAALTDEEGA